MIEDLEARLRAARPEVPDLPAGRSEVMLKRALFEARAPRKRWSTSVALVTVAAACAIVIWYCTAASRHESRTASYEPGVPPKRSEAIVAQSSPQNYLLGRHVKSAEVAVRRIRRSLIGAGRRRARRITAVRRPFVITPPIHDPLVVEQIAPKAPTRGPDPTCEEQVPSVPPGRLVVIVSGANSRSLEVEVTLEGSERTGFARVAAYAPIGPGGGILTQCTIRDAAPRIEATTAQYGVIFGRPPACLTTASDANSSAKAGAEEGLKP